MYVKGHSFFLRVYVFSWICSCRKSNQTTYTTANDVIKLPSKSDGVVLLRIHRRARHPLRQLLQLAQNRPLPLQVTLISLARPFCRPRSRSPLPSPRLGRFLVSREGGHHTLHPLQQPRE